MAEIVVSGSSELNAALKVVQDGDTILLKSGSYSGVIIRNMSFTEGVKITSVDPDNPAVLTDLLVTGSSGININHVNFRPANGALDYCFQVRGSNNVTIDSVHLVGISGDAGYNHSPMMIRNSTNVAVTNSEFEHAWHGLNLLGNKGVTVSGNAFHDLRTDGVRGGGNSDIVISNNFFTDFHPKEGDHPDAIQFWTTNTTKSAENITITGNTVFAGQGDPIQGIFMRDEVGNLAYKNVTVANNFIVGTMYNGISLDRVASGRVENNIVAGLGDEKSWLMVKNSAGVSVSGNSTTDLQFIGNASSSLGTNVQLSAQYDGGQALVQQFAKHLESFLPKEYMTVDTLSSLVAYAYQTLLAKAPPETLITGTDGADRLQATNVGNTRIEAGAGNDTLTGSAIGANKLLGGNGDDTYIVRGVQETVIEGASAGNDTVNSYVSVALAANVENLKVMVEGLTAKGNELDNRIFGSSGTDVFEGLGGADTIQAGGGNDTVSGGAGDDSVRGEDGNDLIRGDDGADRLFGLAGNDRIEGGSGNDQIEGGAGIDFLSGGAGKDVFTFRNGDLAGTSPSAPEIIADFNRAEGDIVALSMIDARSATAADEAFSWIGTRAFSGVAGELRYTVVSGDAFVSGDVNGDGRADFTIELLGVTSLASSDFYL